MIHPQLLYINHRIYHFLYDMVPLSKAPEERLEIYWDIMHAFFFL